MTFKEKIEAMVAAAKMLNLYGKEGHSPTLNVWAVDDGTVGCRLHGTSDPQARGYGATFEDAAENLRHKLGDMLVAQAAEVTKRIRGG